MAGKIKGITIEYSGDTTKLEAAIRRVKSSTSALDRDLKAVNNALKFNPHNTELLKQKQELLKQKVDATKTSLQEFKNIQKQLDAKGVDKTSQAYMKVRRNIIEAESKIRTFNAQLARSKVQGITNLGNGLKSVGAKLTSATRYARRFALALGAIALYKGFERLKSLDETETQMKALGYRGEKLDNIMKSTSESVDGTRFMLQDMAKVATGALGSGVTEKYKLNDYLTRTADLAQLTGMDVKEMGAIMNKAYSKGKVDARLLNQFNARGIPIYKLLQKQLGVNAEKLAEMTRKGKVGFDDLYKATDRYDGLAQKMGTNTLSGAATVLTQQFGLIGAEFLTGVYDPIKGGIQGLVKSIKKLRATGTFKEWGQNFGEAVKYFVEWFNKGEASMDGMSDGAKKLTAVLSPIVKTIGTLVKLIAALPPEVQGFLGAFVLFGGPVLSVLGSITGAIAHVSGSVIQLGLNINAGVGVLGHFAAALGTTAGGLAALAAAGTAAVAWIAAIGIEYYKTKKAQTQYTDSVKEWEAEQDQKIAAVRSENDELNLYEQKLEELMDKEHKSATDKEMIKEYVDKLNGSIDGLNLKYDAEKDKLNKTTKAIREKIEAMKQSALAAAYEEKVTEGAKKLLELKEKEKKLIKERNDYTKKYNSIENKTAAVTAAYNDQMADVNKRLEDNRKAQTKMNQSMDQAAQAAANMAPKVQAQYQKIVAKAKQAGVKIPANLKNGIESGKVAIPTTMNGLYRQINQRFNKAVKAAKDAGVKIPDGLQKKINEGKIKPAKAAARLEKVVSNKLAQSKGKAKQSGKGATEGYASGINNEEAKGKVKSAAKSVKKTADNSMSDNSGAEQAGEWWTTGYAQGIGAGRVLGLVIQAAKKVGKTAKDAANKAQNGGSPSRLAAKIGAWWTEGYAIGIAQNTKMVERASANMVSAAYNAAVAPVPQPKMATASEIGAEVNRAISVNANVGQPVNATFNVTVNGGESPAQFAAELVQNLKEKVRTI